MLESIPNTHEFLPNYFFIFRIFESIQATWLSEIKYFFRFMEKKTRFYNHFIVISLKK